MRKSFNKAILPAILLAFTMLMSANTLKADVVNLITPANYHRCVNLLVNEGVKCILFSGEIDNPNNKKISEMSIIITEKVSGIEVYNKKFEADIAFDGSWAYFYQFDGNTVKEEMPYQWRVTARFDNTVVSSNTYEFSLAVIPSFGVASFADNAICVDLSPILDWTHSVGDGHPDYSFEMQLSRHSNFETLLEVQRVVDTIKTSATPKLKLEPNTRYYWRLQNEMCSAVFSTVRAFTTKVMAPIVVSPPNAAFGSPAFTNDTSVVLRWNDDENPESPTNHYQVQISFDTIFAPARNIVDTFVVNNHFEYQFGKDFSDRRCFWRVRVVDMRENVDDYECASDWTSTHYFRTPLETVRPLSPNKNNCMPRNATFFWEKNEDTEYYQIWASRTEDFKDTVFSMEPTRIVTGEPGDRVTIEHLLPENRTKYYWKIRSVALYGGEVYNSSIWSDVYEFATTFTAPTLVSPANNLREVKDTVTLIWNACTDTNHASYRIQVAKTDKFDSLILNRNTNDTSFFFELQTDINHYYWRVASVDKGGCTSDFTEHYYFTNTLEIPVIITPGKPHTVTPVDTLLSNNVIFRWQKVAQANKYDMEYSLNRNAFDTLYAEVGYRINIVFDSVAILLDTNKTYYWRVRARHDDSVGVNIATSEWSAIHRFVTGCQEPAAPQLISPIENATFVLPNTQFRWTSAAFAGKYELIVSESPDFSNEGNFVVNVVVSDTTYTLDDGLKLESGKKYYWAVYAINQGVKGHLSPIWSFATVPPPPSGIVKLYSPVNNETNVFADNAHFIWGSVASAQYYKLQISENNLFTTTVYDEDIVDRVEIRVVTLELSTKYYWRVKPGNDNGLGENWSETNTFTTSNVLSILDNNYTSFMNIAPNPVNNDAVCHFGLLKDANVTLMIIDALGGEVTRDNFDFLAGEHSVRLRVGNLSNGVYICKIIVNDRIIGTTQFIIAR